MSPFSPLLRRFFFRGLFLLFGSALALSAGCTEESKAPVKVGFIGCLSGKCSDLGTNGRDGVIFALEEINRQGGIVDSKGKTRPIALIVADTKGEKGSAVNEFRQLVKQGAIAVIGPMTSQTGVTLKPEADALQTVLISPTVSTDQLSDQDDYFFRVYPTTHVIAPALAKLAIEVNKSQTFSIVHSDLNAAFVDSWIKHFSGDVTAGDGNIIGVHPIKREESIYLLAQRIVAEGPDTVLIVANAYDTGMLIQQIRKLESKLQILGTEWSTTGSLAEFSGRGLEGAYFVSSFDNDSQAPAYLEFRRKFQERLGREASFAAQFGFEALHLLESALRIQPDAKQLKETLKTIGTTNGLQGKLTMDAFGEVQRNIFIKQFINGGFKTVAQWDGEVLKLVSQP